MLANLWLSICCFLFQVFLPNTCIPITLSCNKFWSLVDLHWYYGVNKLFLLHLSSLFGISDFFSAPLCWQQSDILSRMTFVTLAVFVFVFFFQITFSSNTLNNWLSNTIMAVYASCIYSKQSFTQRDSAVLLLQNSSSCPLRRLVEFRLRHSVCIPSLEWPAKTLTLEW